MNIAIESVDQSPGRDIKGIDIDKIPPANDTIRESSWCFYIQLAMSSPRFDMQIMP
jgi:hypothetical protein